MNKKKIIFILPQLDVGGVQKTFLSVQRVIDYDKYDVTLYLRKDRQALKSSIDSRINIIANDDNNKYYRKSYAVLLQLLIMFMGVFGLKSRKEKLTEKLNRLIVHYSMEYEYEKYFKYCKYDVAVAYVQGYPALLCGKYVEAEKKILIFHTSVDELHDVNASVIDNFDIVCALHDGQAELIKKWYPSVNDRISIVNNYVDYKDIIKKSLEFKAPECEKKVICTCGRMTKVKGFDLACRTAKVLKDNGIDFLWRFVGDGVERANIERLVCELGISDNIEFTGMQQNPYPYIASCDIYVQPSYEESYGLSIREAQMLSRPVVSTRTMGGSTLIKDMYNGMLCDFSPEALAEAVTLMLTDDDLYKSICDNVKEYSADDEDRCRAQWNRLLEC